MIVKKRDGILYLMQLQALERRLPKNHARKARVVREKINESTGVKGEKEIDYPLSFLNSTHYRILHSLRLHDEQGAFQIDSLILNQKFLLILEVKNWFGKILFGENDQVIRINEHQEAEGFPNPLLQVRLQQYRLQKWLRSRNLPDIPITFLVVIAFPSTIIEQASAKGNIPDSVIHNNKLIFRIKGLSEQFEDCLISVDQMDIMAQTLKESHSPIAKNAMEIFDIDKTDLVKGVQCPECLRIPMHRKSKGWVCLNCHHKSHTAHIEAINDYLLLIDDKVSNQKMREFLLVESPNVVRNLLKKEYRYIGNNKARLYQLALK